MYLYKFYHLKRDFIKNWITSVSRCERRSHNNLSTLKDYLIIGCTRSERSLCFILSEAFLCFRKNFVALGALDHLTVSRTVPLLHFEVTFFTSCFRLRIHSVGAKSRSFSSESVVALILPRQILFHFLLFERHYFTSCSEDYIVRIHSMRVKCQLFWSDRGQNDSFALTFDRNNWINLDSALFQHPSMLLQRCINRFVLSEDSVSLLFTSKWKIHPKIFRGYDIYLYTRELPQRYRELSVDGK